MTGKMRAPRTLQCKPFPAQTFDISHCLPFLKSHRFDMSLLNITARKKRFTPLFTVVWVRHGWPPNLRTVLQVYYGPIFLNDYRHSKRSPCSGSWDGHRRFLVFLRVLLLCSQRLPSLHTLKFFTCSKIWTPFARDTIQEWRPSIANTYI